MIKVVATISLVAITAVWGLTFVTVKEALQEIPPYQFLAIRWWLATIVMATALLTRLRTITPQVLRAGTAAGTALALGYACQTVGLIYIGATDAGFLTGLFVVFTPPLSAIFLRKWPHGRVLGAVVLATAGLLLLTGGTGVSLSYGELLLVGTALSFALHIVLLGKYSPNFDTASLTFVQMALAALAFTGISLAFENLTMSIDASVWRALLLTGLVASALGFFVQTWAQRYLSPVRTSITLTMEPVFAGLFGFLLLGETLGYLGWLGAAMILSAMIISGLRGYDVS